MLLRTSEGTIDARAVQTRAAEQLKSGMFVVSNEMVMAIGLLATVIDELESCQSQVENLREIDQLRENLRKTMTY